MFNYGILTWTTGFLSGGDTIDGLGGSQAGVSIKSSVLNGSYILSFPIICRTIIIIIIIILNLNLNPRKTRVGKKLKKLKRMERLMFRAVVQLKTIVQQNRIETK